MPTTEVVGSNVIVSWTAPSSNGSPILAYVITFRDTSGNYHLNLADCNGTQQSIVTSRTCTVPLTVLYGSPFSLALGDHIYAIVIAVNSYGNSVASTPGDGAAVVLVPDAPTNIANNPAMTSAT